MLKEWNARDNAYMIADRRGEWLLLGQRLPLVASFINSSIAREAPAAARASQGELWEIRASDIVASRN